MGLISRVRSALTPPPDNGECPVTGDTFLFESHRHCPHCGWPLRSPEGAPVLSHRRTKGYRCEGCGAKADSKEAIEHEEGCGVA